MAGSMGDSLGVISKFRSDGEEWSYGFQECPENCGKCGQRNSKKIMMPAVVKWYFDAQRQEKVLQLER
jgi:hypothetical protein